MYDVIIRHSGSEYHVFVTTFLGAMLLWHRAKAKGLWARVNGV